jgi:UDP-N-acetylmuramoyl-tripeptide--D-alanyl-D-alanine ligase
VGTAHIGLLGSREAIAEAKCELLQYMDSQGTAILNADNSLLMETARSVWQGQTVTFGMENGDLRGRLLDTDTLKVIESSGNSYTVKLPLPGNHNATNFLAVLAAVKVLQQQGKFDYQQWRTANAPLEIELPDGRAQRYQLPQDIVVLDETYNAGTESMVAALQLLAQTPGKRKIAVLGTMKELGNYSVDFHRQVGAAAASRQVDALFVCADSPEAEAMVNGASGVPHVVSYSPVSQEQLLQDLLAFLQPGDRILLKASHSVGLNRLVNNLRSAWAEKIIPH